MNIRMEAQAVSYVNQVWGSKVAFAMETITFE